MRESLPDAEGLYPLDTLVIDVDTTKTNNEILPFIAFNPIDGYEVSVVTGEGVKIYNDRLASEEYENGFIKNTVADTYWYVFYKGKGKLFIHNKYYLKALYFGRDINDGTYAYTLNVNQFLGLNNIEAINLYYGNTYGNINNLRLCANLNSFKIVPDGAGQTFIDGDLAVFGNLNNMSELLTQFIKTACDISKLDNIKQQIQIKFNTLIYGDASNLKAKFLSTSGAGSNAILSWPSENSRPMSLPIIALENTNFGDDLDNMLINQANCEFITPSTTYESTHWLYELFVYGNRTSKSDMAIAVLKSKGLYIKINDITM